MSKFKAGDWCWCDLAKFGDTMLVSGFYVHDVLPNGGYVVEASPGSYRIWGECQLGEATLAEGCTGWDYVMPKPIDPGEGYRLLSPDEPVVEGDEYCSPICGWLRSGNFGGTQSKGYSYRRKLEPKTETWVEWLCVEGFHGGVVRWLQEGKQPSPAYNWSEKTGRTITREVKT